jgi:hypothetical protein
MKLRSLQLVILPGLLAALLIMASSLAAQDNTGNFALTATALAGGGSVPGTATITPLPSLTPGGPVVVTSTPAVPTPLASALPSLTPGLRASLTPLPSLTPMGQTAPTEAPTVEPTRIVTLSPSSTPLPSLTEIGAAPAGEMAGTPSGEVQLEATVQDAGATAAADGLAPVSIEVPYVSLEQEPPAAPEGAAGLGTLILLFGLGGATVIGLLMLARDRYRDHRED